MISHEELLNTLHYDPETGVFTWRIDTISAPVGTRAGSYCQKGYRYITIAGKRRPEHRLAYFYTLGTWPADQIDHIDGDRANNKWSNLRLATNSENNRNSKRPCTNTSGHKGISRKYNCWRARVVVDNRYHEKMFIELEEAVAWVRGLRTKLHGDFANHG